MRMAILSILLWPIDTSKSVRRIQFDETGINVVTGKSGTGKSSLLHIVDYCLGSGKCSIPVGHIRDFVAWFGLHLRLKDREIVLARRNPGEQEQTGDIFWVEGSFDDPTSVIPVKNQTAEDLKRRFNEMAGFSDLPLDPSRPGTGFNAPASFRDMAAFNFQPQHIVANPHALFFKTDSFEHRQKLVTVFPLALGAVTATQLAARWQLELEEADLDRRQRELDQLNAASNQWLSEIRGVYTRARELGLLPKSMPANDVWPAEHYLRLLREVPDNLADRRPVSEIGATDEILERVRSLEDEEMQVARKIADRKRSLHRLQRLSSSVHSYGATLHSQRDRLFGLGWLRDKIPSMGPCPFCGQTSDSAKRQIEQLWKLAGELNEMTAKTVESSPMLDREIAQLERDIRKFEVDLETIQKEKWQLEDRSAELEARRRTLTTVYRFVGRIEQALEGYWKTEDDSHLRRTIAALQQHVQRLRGISNSAREREVVQATLEKFTTVVAFYVDRLRLERAGDPVQLNIKELMLKVLSRDGRADALWEIGSAENWMGYHVATMLALHELFLEQADGPVPTFLMIDQPSQAYFPDRWPGDATDTSESTENEAERELERRSEDIAGVHRVFETLALAIERCKGKLQIIVTEHAGEITWRSVSGVNLVGNWRPGKDQYLIPQDWLRK